MGRKLAVRQQRRAREKKKAVPQVSESIKQKISIQNQGVPAPRFYARKFDWNLFDLDEKWDSVAHVDIQVPGKDTFAVIVFTGDIVAPLHYDDLDRTDEFIREACLEFWDQHDFEQEEYCQTSKEVIDRLPSDWGGLRSFMRRKNPKSVVTALSINSFFEWAIGYDDDGGCYFNDEPDPGDVEMWFDVIWAICKPMWIIYKEHPGLTPKELYCAATQLIDKVHGFHWEVDSLKENPLCLEN